MKNNNLKLAQSGLRFSLFFLLLTTLSVKVEALTYYSINNGGWSNASSWSLSSGGFPALKAPSDTDDVIIENNALIILDGNRTCKTLTLGNNGIGSLNFGNFILTIEGVTQINLGSTISTNNNGTGSIIAKGNFINLGNFIPGTSSLHMSGLTTQVLRVANVNNLTIRNPSGVQLNTNIIVEGVLNLVEGTLNLNGNFLSITFTNSDNRITCSPAASINGSIPNSTLRLSVNASVTNSQMNIFIPSIFKSNLIDSMSIRFASSNGASAIYFNDEEITANAILTLSSNRVANTTYYKSLKINRGLNRTTTDNKSLIGFINPTTTSKLTLGDGSNKSGVARITLQGSVAKLVVNCGNGNFSLLGYHGTANHDAPITQSIELVSGSINISSNLNLKLNNGKTLIRTNGSMNKAPTIVSGSYNVLYNGENDIISTPELFPSNPNSLGSVAVDMASTQNTIFVPGTNVLNLQNNLIITKGHFSIGNANINIRGSVAVASPNGNFSMTNQTLFVGGNFHILGTFNTGSCTINMNGASTQTVSASRLHHLTINNSTGVIIQDSNLTLNGKLNLVNGELTLSSNIRLTLNTHNPITRSNGTIDASAIGSNLRIETPTNVNSIIPTAFSNKTIRLLSCSGGINSSITFENDEIIANTVNYSGGVVNFKTLKLIGTFALGRFSGGIIGISNELVLGDGTNRNTTPGISLSPNLAIPRLSINVGNGSINLANHLPISHSVNLISGTLNLSNFNLNIASGTIFTRANGRISKAPNITLGSYDVVYNGTLNITGTPELFPTGGGSVNDITLQLNNTSTFVTPNPDTLKPLGNINVNIGTLNLSAITILANGKALSTGLAGIVNTNNFLVTSGSNLIQTNNNNFAGEKTKENTYFESIYKNQAESNANKTSSIVDNFNNLKPITIYPNPNLEGKLFIQNGFSEITYTIFDMSGAKVLIGDYQNTNGIDISNLKEGVFFIQIQTTQGNKTCKFIKGI